MPARKVSVAPLHDLPATVEFTLADGTRLTASVRLSPRARRAKLSLTPRGDLVLTIPLTMGPAQLQSSLPLFLPWLERARTTLLRRVPAPQLPSSITLPLTGETFAVMPSGDMASGRKAARATTVQVANGARRLLLVESADQVRLYGAVDDISLCAQALRQWCRKKAARLLPPYLEQLAAMEGFALAGVSVRDQSGRWGSCARLRRGQPPQPEAQRSKLPQGNLGRPRSLEQLTTRIRNFFSTPPLPATHDAAPFFAQSGSDLAPANPEGRISLNWRALLLPAPLLEHLCWHELCHLRQMDHSPAYREELARFSPQWPAHEKALNAAWRGLPWWALPGEDASPSR